MRESACGRACTRQREHLRADVHADEHGRPGRRPPPPAQQPRRCRFRGRVLAGPGHRGHATCRRRPQARSDGRSRGGRCSEMPFHTPTCHASAGKNGSQQRSPALRGPGDWMSSSLLAEVVVALAAVKSARTQAAVLESGGRSHTDRGRCRCSLSAGPCRHEPRDSHDARASLRGNPFLRLLLGSKGREVVEVVVASHDATFLDSGLRLKPRPAILTDRARAVRARPGTARTKWPTASRGLPRVPFQ